MEAAEGTAEYRQEWDYGYGGESYSYDRIDNWYQVVREAVLAYLIADHKERSGD